MKSLSKFRTVILDKDGTLYSTKLMEQYWLRTVLGSIRLHDNEMESWPFDRAQTLIRSAPWTTVIHSISEDWSSRSKSVSYDDASELVTHFAPKDTWKYQHSLIAPWVVCLMGERTVLYTEDYREPTLKLLERDGLKNDFGMVVCAGNIPWLSKNSTAGLHFILGEMESTPEETCMIGDSNCDITIGNLSGCYTIAIRPDGIPHPEADRTVAHLGDLF